ncbi:MAG TPA: hypothetical protein DCR04_08450, partial [Flavobacteriales bacterium]|nr:hypothetical protein [Flavobacteriales bacterium]
GTAAVTLTGTASGTYSSTVGLTIDGVTGEIDLVASTPGTYTVTFPFTDGNGCSGSTSTSVTIHPLSTATISYAGTPYCATGTAAVTLTGTAGGTYSSTAGLNFNGTAGEIDLATSTPGTYTVTYNFTDGNGCSGSTNTSVTINVLPSVTVSTDTTLCLPSAFNGLLSGSLGGSATQGEWTFTPNSPDITLSPTGFTNNPGGVTVTIASGFIGTIAFTLTSNDPNGCGAAASATSNVTILGDQAATTWTGAIDDNWHEPDNWTNCVPGPTTVTTIAATANNPRITAADADCFNIEVQNGAQVEITGSLQLNVYE